MSARFDAIVVGAGPAGSAAALLMARGGMKVLLLERGEYPGAKNVSGAAFYGSAILHEVVPDFWAEAPLERHIARRTIAFMSPTTSVALDFRTSAYSEPPYNGFTVMRPHFDRWLAGKAVEAGAFLLCSTVADDLLLDGDRVVGVRVRRADGEVEAPLVIACDGVNSFLAKKAGLRGELDAHEVSLGVKEVLGLDRRLLEQRFSLRGDEGAVAEYIGDITDDVTGGGFLYTNQDSIAIGVIGQLSSFAERRRRPDELLERFKAHPSVAPLLEGAKPREYSAHLVPEAGWSMMPKLYRPGMLVAGDAAGLCFATGLYLEGINYALQSGFAAAETALEAHAAQDSSASMLRGYEARLEARHVTTDFKAYRDAPAFVNSERLANTYPGLVTRSAERLFRVDGRGKRKLLAIAREAMKEARVSNWQVLRDVYRGMRAFGW
ncbi:MAG: FAD-dependent oxidoreductase [Sandaracinaceae bacterium]